MITVIPQPNGSFIIRQGDHVICNYRIADDCEGALIHVWTGDQDIDEAIITPIGVSRRPSGEDTVSAIKGENPDLFEVGNEGEGV
jgi:hypothetical protein